MGGNITKECEGADSTDLLRDADHCLDCVNTVMKFGFRNRLGISLFTSFGLFNDAANISKYCHAYGV
jgi:hypothetical protein